MSLKGIHVGTVVGNTSADEFRFLMRRYAARLGDLVCVNTTVPRGEGSSRDVMPQEEVTVWGRIVELVRYNPFLPAEAGQELADEGLYLRDTVLSLSRDQVDGKVLILGMTSADDETHLRPLGYPVNPGADVLLPHADAVKKILTAGDEDAFGIKLGALIGRPSYEVKIKTNAIVARHMAILAMTGGGKTVAARRIIRELLKIGYPLLILDPHGDYLGLYTKRNLFPERTVKLCYPHLGVSNRNKDLVGYLISQMTQGLTDAQREQYDQALDGVSISDAEINIIEFIDRLVQRLETMQAQHRGTIPAVRRGLRMVRRELEAMEKSNERLRQQPGLREFPFEAMPDPLTAPGGFVAPNQATILYLGGYDHITQSTIVAVVLKHLFDHRASMSNEIPPFFTVIEEAHNFIPSRGEGQAETPSVEVIRKVITEGRKFGTGLLLVSQRPSRLDETALSQCNTFLIFRLVNPRDQSFVERVMENLSKDDGRLLPGFGPGQGIVSGQAVRFPLIIQVEHDQELETAAIGDENFIKVAKEWTRSPQAEAAQLSSAMIEELNTIRSTGSQRRQL